MKRRLKEKRYQGKAKARFFSVLWKLREKIFRKERDNCRMTLRSQNRLRRNWLVLNNMQMIESSVKVSLNKVLTVAIWKL